MLLPPKYKTEQTNERKKILNKEGKDTDTWYNVDQLPRYYAKGNKLATKRQRFPLFVFPIVVKFMIQNRTRHKGKRGMR